MSPILHIRVPDIPNVLIRRAEATVPSTTAATPTAHASASASPSPAPIPGTDVSPYVIGAFVVAGVVICIVCVGAYMKWKKKRKAPVLFRYLLFSSSACPLCNITPPLRCSACSA
ncbi:hypothetical protein BOTBODRAFT_184860 [Botryobasidium botryosum FD-172 SS1]|uniref:Uncharacterized protein n=1 Tax=Botryobasidium botryosum (strain FD-172 SS1) TaxID=930990 RepID=A0A067MTK5_BOTB1|nr:hypothetical protein BOTBODRAFT_184860 [Botryobasidium botryosum FD-172 SS1]